MKIDKTDLINFFNNGCKEPENRMIGTEHEKFLFNLTTCKPVNISGPEPNLESIFQKLKANNWNEVKENGVTIGFKKEKLNITFEPGYQIELSGDTQSNIHQTCIEVNSYLKELKNICTSMGVGIIGIGFIPNVKIEEIPKLEKKRYQIMRDYMPNVGTLGLDMMHRTAATQINIDYTSENDFKKKCKVASCIVPIAATLFSNSPFKDNKLNKFLSNRSYIWQDTDKKRSGLLPFFFENNSFEKYCDFALDVPMYFIQRGKEIIDCKGLSFKKFLANSEKSLEKYEPTLDDWKNHLSTIFTEVRLKQYLEIRSADSCSWSGICSIPAFWTGILYSDLALDEAFDYVKNWKYEEVNDAYHGFVSKGFKTELDKKNIKKHAEYFLSLSRKGLELRNKLNANNEDESCFLNEIENIINKSETPSEKLASRYKNVYKNNLNNLLKNEAF